MAKEVKQIDRVIIRFAGDSGDGMQLTGDRFTQESAAFGNDLVTLPNFPAEIRAPQGTIPGVSSFQVHFADHDILTAGDAPDVLVSMNPATLKANLAELPKGAAIIVDTHDFTDRNLAKAGYSGNPLEDDSLAEFAVHPVELTGPAPCPIDRIRGRWRWHFLLRSTAAGPLGAIARLLLTRYRPPRRSALRLIVDRDPVSLL